MDARDWVFAAALAAILGITLLAILNSPPDVVRSENCAAHCKERGAALWTPDGYSRTCMCIYEVSR